MGGSHQNLRKVRKSYLRIDVTKPRAAANVPECKADSTTSGNYANCIRVQILTRTQS